MPRARWNKGFVYGLAIYSAVLVASFGLTAPSADAQSPTRLLKKDRPVDWWFAFKFNADRFPACGGPQRSCPFDRDATPLEGKPFGQQFVFASQSDDTLAKGEGCIGDATNDPVGATFAQVYNGSYYYIVWNDQFYGDPKTPMCSSCGKGTAHSKGMLAWDDSGQGLVMQVTTPSWPGAGNKRFPRKEAANTLGCIVKPNNVIYSQHFFPSSFPRTIS